MHKEGFIDKDLGEVYILRNVRAKNIIARRKTNYIQLTVPLYASEKQIREAFLKLKPRLFNIKLKPEFILDPNTSLNTFSFSLKIENQKVINYYVNLDDHLLRIICPSITNFHDIVVQKTLRNAIEQVMRKEAKRIFPLKAKVLAKNYNLTYSNININKSRSRWGSCSSKKSINLSYFCLFLPEYLIDFVILHELCHTLEMNHSDRFWKLLDSVTNDRSKELTSELKSITIPW